MLLVPPCTTEPNPASGAPATSPTAAAAFAPWGAELTQECGFDQAARCIVSGPAARALESAARPMLAGSTQVLAFDSDPRVGVDAALRSWFWSNSTLPRAQCLVRPFPSAATLLGANFCAGREAMLERGGRLVVLGWSDDSWGSGERIFAKALSMIGGGKSLSLAPPATSSAFRHVAQRVAQAGGACTLRRGHRQWLQPEQTWALLAASRFAPALAALGTGRCERLRALVLEALRRTPPASSHAALEYLVLRKS